MPPPVSLDMKDGVAHVVPDEPDRGNPFDLEFCVELSRVATACDENRACGPR